MNLFRPLEYMLTCGKGHYVLLFSDLFTILRRLWSSSGFMELCGLVSDTLKFVVLLVDVLFWLGYVCSMCKLNIGALIINCRWLSL